MHNKPIEQVLNELKTSAKGLSQKEAEERLKQYGLNEIKEGKKISPWEIFLNQFKSIVILILVIATLISGFLKEYIDAIVIIVIVILIAILGFIQEYRAERAIEALKKLSSLKATVIRDGQKKEIDSKELVPGDIILLAQGDKVAADARLIEASGLRVDESLLTGESIPVSKQCSAVDEAAGLHARANMVFKDTVVVGGKAAALVVGTGLNTELGKIAESIHVL